MKLKQLIYTALKGQGDDLGGYRYFGVSAGVSENDREEVASLFASSLAVRRYVEHHPSPERLTQETVDREAPVRYAYLRLRDGRYCWCCVSALARDYCGNLGGIIFHALISDDAPRFRPIALFEHVHFVTSLNPREQQIPSTVILPEITVDDDIECSHDPADNRLNILEAQYLISAMNRAMKESRPLIINIDESAAPMIFAELFSYVSVSDAVRMTFSTMTDSEEDAKRFAVSYLGRAFDYRAALSHRSVITADAISGSYSDGLIVDKYARIVTDLAYHDRKHYSSFLKFLSAYSLRVANYDSQRALDMYYFLIADKYRELPPDSFLNVLDDEYLRGIPSSEIAPKIEKYIASSDHKEHWLELYAGLYRFAEDKAAVSGKVVGYCFNNIIKSNDLSLREQYKEMLARDFDSDFYLDILAAYDGIRSAIIGNINRAGVFELVIAILSSNLTDAARHTADRMFADVFKAMSTKSELIRDKLMPAVAFDSGYFGACMDHLYPRDKQSLTDVLAWIDFARRNTQQDVSRAFMIRALDDLSSDRLFTEIVRSRASLDDVLKRIKLVYPMEGYSEHCLKFIHKAIDSNILATDLLAAVLAPVRSEQEVFIDCLLRIRKQCGDERFTSIIYLFTKSEGVGFVKSISAAFPDVASGIISHNANTPDRYINIYIKEFYNTDHLADKWREMFDRATAGLSPAAVCAAVVSVLSTVRPSTDSQLVEYMCSLYDSLLWQNDHIDRDRLVSELAVVAKHAVGGVKYENISLFRELLSWGNGGQKKQRHRAAIATVTSIVIDSAEKRAFLAKYYPDAIVAMSAVALKKHGDTFLLYVLATSAPDGVGVIWSIGYKKQSARLRCMALTYWLDLAARETVSDPAYHSELLEGIFASLRDSDFVKLYKSAKKKGATQVIHSLRAYSAFLPERARAKAAALLGTQTAANGSSVNDEKAVGADNSSKTEKTEKTEKKHKSAKASKAAKPEAEPTAEPEQPSETAAED